MMRITVVIPVYNGDQTVKKTLECLFRQERFFDELIIINNGSIDKSLEVIESFLNTSTVRKHSCEVKILNHKKPRGLARTYNEAIEKSTGDLIVTLHQDIELFDDSLEKLVSPFFNNTNNNIVASSHIVLHPKNIWNQYNFWGKVYFARLVEKSFPGIDGKFDCFRKKALLNVGLFDSKHFHSAGEDGDMVFKLKEIGLIMQTEAKIIHKHNMTNFFGPKEIIYKQKQYSEAQGALLRLGRINTLSDIVRSFFREILIISLFLPYISKISVAAILIYSFFYSKQIFFSEFKNPRIFIVPLLNIYLLPVSLVYSLKSFFYGKQKL